MPIVRWRTDSTKVVAAGTAAHGQRDDSIDKDANGNVLVAINRSYTAPNAVITSGGTISAAVNQQIAALAGFVIPAAFTGTVLTFQVSADNATYQALYDETGTAVSVPVVAGRSYSAPASLASWPYFKFVSGSAEAASRTIVTVLKS